ncbi:hypothetical protein CEXT_396241 [Caerostris extrusa]|uniref:Uncharacterized protein n=1 Tax=Caerostris extrusa TaxID=172846 RepID=A0AAV4R8Y5_CAEEX|nr:hypothetical protein CEXT_396241 [Caerostris extrusa]
MFSVFHIRTERPALQREAKEARERERGLPVGLPPGEWGRIYLNGAAGPQPMAVVSVRSLPIPGLNGFSFPDTSFVYSSFEALGCVFAGSRRRHFRLRGVSCDPTPLMRTSLFLTPYPKRRGKKRPTSLPELVQ